MILGKKNFDRKKHWRDLDHWEGLGVLLDLRGDVRIHRSAHFGYEVAILSASHAYGEKGMGRIFLRTVKIDKRSWVGSRALLYNCWIQEHAIVGAGAVVKNAVVPAWSLVEGNPAVIVSRFDAERGRYVRLGHTEALEGF